MKLHVQRTSAFALCGIAIGLLACAESEPDPMAQPSAGGAGGVGGTSAQPIAGAAGVGTPPPIDLPSGGTMASPIATGGTGASNMQPAGGDPAPEPTGNEAARFPDACAERRNSWGKPCTDNPNPCNINSGYEGDEYCLVPPPEGMGVQIHFGPKNYDDPAELEKYVLEPGEEQNAYGIVNVPTTEDRWYSYVKLSMRPGSHHVINSLVEGHPAEGFVAGSCEGDGTGGFVGTQTLILESPPQGIPAPENEGLGRKLPANSSICQNYHRYNFTDMPMLSEIWYNVWFTEEENVTQRAEGVAVFAGPRVGIGPGEETVISHETTVSGDGRIITLFGHRHAATWRFGAWLNDELVYDSWDWVESRVFNYDSITDNPAPNPAGKMDGAVSGMLEVKEGDVIRVECHVKNETDQTLRFSNELYGGEMCILFGSAIGVGIN